MNEKYDHNISTALRDIKAYDPFLLNLTISH